MSCNMPDARANGEDLYFTGNYKEAEAFFRQKDMDNPKDVRWRYNRGCAAYKNEDLSGSEASFQSVLARSEDKELKAKAAYNLGNINYKKGEFETAVIYYKDALKFDPDDEDTKHNLGLALVMKKISEQKEEENKNQCDNPNKDENNDQDNQNDDQNENNDQSNNNNQDNQNNDNGDKNQENANNKDNNNENETDDKNENGEKQKNEDLANNNDKKPQPGKQGQQVDQPDLSQDLEAAQAMPQMDENDQDIQTPENQMEYRKAQALLENIQENREVLMQQLKEQGKDKPVSGKHW